MTFWIQKDRVRVQTRSLDNRPGVTMIYRADRRLVYVLNDTARTYLEIPRNAAVESRLPPRQAVDMRFTRRSKTVAGYSCEEVIVRNAGEETRIWCTTKLASLAEAMGAALGMEGTEGAADWTGDLRKRGLFPMKASTMLDGKLIESQEVTAVRPGGVNASLFELPANFRKERVRDMILDGMR